MANLQETGIVAIVCMSCIVTGCLIAILHDSITDFVIFMPVDLIIANNKSRQIEKKLRGWHFNIQANLEVSFGNL